MPETPIEIIIPSSIDGTSLLELARSITLFSQNDIDIIQELWEEFAKKGDNKSHYHFIVAKRAGTYLGFACYGRRPLTKSTFDLYWIGVGQDWQGQGIGKMLIHAVEEQIHAQNGNLLIAETEGQASFASTRHFYSAVGYQSEARIKDFYCPGNDLVIFTKHF